MTDNIWVLVFGGIFAFLNAFAVGANMPANCWGAIIGAKVVKYRTAVLLGIVCELVGSLVFDPRVAAVYNGVLKDWTVLKPFPGLTLYALMWAQITPTVMQLLAIRKQILVPPFLGFGATFVFPGVRCLDGGKWLSAPPFLSGLGPAFLVWLIAPLMTLTLVTLAFLILRTCLLRGEDPFHKVLWAMPGTACGAAIVWGLQVFFAISSAQGLDFATWAPQETAILLAAIGSGGCLLTCLAVPRMQRFMKTRGPSTIPLKRMNLLGLDEATVRELAEDDRAGDMTGWLQRLHAWLFEGDIFADVASNDVLLRIHSTAEEFEGAAEECFVPLQVITCMVMTIAFASNSARTSLGLFAIMLRIYSTESVTLRAPIPLWLHVLGAIGLCLGTLLCSFRLVPVTATQIAKMTPFRSFVVTVVSSLTLAILAILQLRSGTTTYVMLTAVLAVGLAEGSSHCNGRQVRYTIVWWAVSFAVVMLSTSILVAQGMYAPSIHASTGQTK